MSLKGLNDVKLGKWIKMSILGNFPVLDFLFLETFLNCLFLETFLNCYFGKLSSFVIFPKLILSTFVIRKCLNLKGIVQESKKEE